MKNSKTILMMLAILAAVTTIYAQAASISMLSTARGATLSNTFGEMSMLQIFMSGLYSLTQGFNQPEFTYNSALTLIELPVLMSMYPNPVAENATLFLSSPQISKRKIAVRNITGQELQKINDGVLPEGVQTFDIDVSMFAPGIYFITITDENAQEQIFKFIKQ